MNLIELLMTQLVKLDGIVTDGDLKHQKRMQVKSKCHLIKPLTGFFFFFAWNANFVDFFIEVVGYLGWIAGEESAKVCGETGCAQGEE